MNKYLIILFVILLTSCIEETINGYCWSEYIIPEWDMVNTREISLSIYDNELKECDDISIKIYSDMGDSTYLHTYRIEQNTIILESNEKFQNSNYDDCIKRGRVYLIYNH